VAVGLQTRRFAMRHSGRVSESGAAGLTARFCSWARRFDSSYFSTRPRGPTVAFV
jgi:hypothetical protein